MHRNLDGQQTARLKMLLGVGLFGVLLFSGCGYVSPPAARVEFATMAVQVENTSPDAWTQCQFIINKQAGADKQYVFDAGDVAGLETKTVLTAQFSQVDGKRFIPILTEAHDFAIQCQKPVLPFEMKLNPVE